MSLTGGTVWQRCMAFLVVIMTACLLISSAVHAAEPILENHLTEQGFQQTSHQQGGKLGGHAGCLVHCPGHNIAAPPSTTLVSQPVLEDADWSFTSTLDPPTAPSVGLERPPRV